MAATPRAIAHARASAGAVDRIIRLAAHHYGVEPAQIRARDRTGRVAMARHVAIHVAHQHTGLSLSALGAAFGRHHGTIISSLRLIEGMMGYDPRLRAEVYQIETAVYDVAL